MNLVSFSFFLVFTLRGIYDDSVLRGVYDDYVIRGVYDDYIIRGVYDDSVLRGFTGIAFFIFCFIVISSYSYESFTTILSYVELMRPAS